MEVEANAGDSPAAENTPSEPKDGYTCIHFPDSTPKSEADKGEEQLFGFLESKYGVDAKKIVAEGWKNGAATSEEFAKALTDAGLPEDVAKSAARPIEYRCKLIDGMLEGISADLAEGIRETALSEISADVVKGIQEEAPSELPALPTEESLDGTQSTEEKQAQLFGAAFWNGAVTQHHQSTEEREPLMFGGVSDEAIRSCAALLEKLGELRGINVLVTLRCALKQGGTPEDFASAFELDGVEPELAKSVGNLAAAYLKGAWHEKKSEPVGKTGSDKPQLQASLDADIAKANEGAREAPSKLPTLPTEEWLDRINKLEMWNTNAVRDLNHCRTELYGSWLLIGIVLTLVGLILTAHRHGGWATLCLAGLGVMIAWYSIRQTGKNLPPAPHDDDLM